MQNLQDYIQKQSIIEILADSYIPGHFMYNAHNILYDFVFGCDTLGNPTIYGDYLSEGLTRSYDPNATIRIVSDFLKKDESEFIVVDIHTKEDKDEIIDRYLDSFDTNKEQIMFIKCKRYKDNYNRETVESIKKSFEFCGYYYATTKPGGRPDYEWLYFYPKFQVKINELVRKENKFLYHITTKDIAEKIKHNGFVPKSTNEKFDYPGRIHLLKENTPDHVKSGLLGGLKDQSKNKIHSNKDNRRDIKFVEIKIDLKKIDKTTNFYTDPDFSRYGIFTYDNIKPNAIVSITEIK